MDDGLTLSAGSPNAGADFKEYAFNSTSNLFLSVGGYPSTGWEIVAPYGTRPVIVMSLDSFTAEFNL